MNETKKEDNKPRDFSLDFSGFILTLNTSALIHLGEIPDPQTRQRMHDLHAAKHTIEILELLEEKTKGNLTNEEKVLLEDVVYELRMKYMKSSK